MTRKKDAERLPGGKEGGPGKGGGPGDGGDDDRRAFEQAMQGARPLNADRRRTRGELPPVRPARAPAPPAPPPPARLRAIEPAGTDAGDRYAYLAGGESIDRLRELRSGRMRPEAELDLHGQTAEAAARALGRFVASARQRDQRLLLVIHGRGHGSGPTGPVLRQQVIEQLAEGPLAPEVLAVVSAPAALGGAGAALVLLRRRR
jgi:DNA-nicking Smr family endonuclease